MIYAQLPPLNSVKAFDAVVRHGSISEASRVLCVSQSAVSRHIAKLEDFVGSKLLIRGKLGAVATAEGKEFFEQISQSLDSILDVTTKLRATHSGVNIIKVSSLSSFALKWLVPRLNVFRAVHPDIILDVSISDQRPNFEQSQKDCAIVSVAADALLKGDDILFDEELVVVASPALLENGTLKHQDDLGKYPLIHTSTRAELWGTLFKQLDLIENPDALPGLSFQDFYISIAACVAGSGIGLVPSFLVRKELEDGSLIQALDATFSSGKSYRLAVSPFTNNNKQILDLQRWLIQETGDERDKS